MSFFRGAWVHFRALGATAVLAFTASIAVLAVSVYVLQLVLSDPSHESSGAVATVAIAATDLGSFDRGYMAGAFIIPAAVCIGVTIELLWFVGAFRNEPGENRVEWYRRHEKRLP